MIIALGLTATLSLLAAAADPPGTAPAAPVGQASGVTIKPESTVTYAPPKAADQKDEQVVCHSEAVLGSRLPVRRCRTVRDIKDRMLNDQQMVEHAQQNLQIRSN